MKIGMISFAHMHALSYADALTRMEGVRIAGVADEDALRGREMADRFGTIYFPDCRELMAVSDAVVICSENAKHAELAMEAARMGKHILCEKPIATTVEDARAMIEAASEHGVQLMIAFPARYSEPAKKMKRMLEGGELGRIMAMSGTNRGKMPGGWFVDPASAGGGAVMDHTVHVLDLMHWYMPGAAIKQVYAEIDTRFHDIPSDDCGILSFEFDNGVIGSLDPSWSIPESYPAWGDLSLKIVGTKGVAYMDSSKQFFVEYPEVSENPRWISWKADADAQLVGDFVRSIRRGEPVPITGEDGLKAMEVALMAYRSAELKQPVARMSPPTGSSEG